MNIKNIFSKILNRGPVTVSFAVILSVLFVTGLVSAASTISTNIATDGTLSVTGLSSLGQATSTMFSAYSAYFGGSATSTFDSTGALTINGGLTVSTGSTALAAATVTSLKVATAGTVVSGIYAGYCVTTAADIAAAVSPQVGSSTVAYVICTPAGGATLAGGLVSRVFVQATSSLPSYIILQSASTTSTNLISVRLLNTSTSTPVTAGIYSFNFWAFQ